MAPGRGRRRTVSDRRIPGHRAVAELDPLLQQHPVRDHRPPIPPQRRVLRVHPAVPAVPRPLGAGRPVRRAAGHGAQPLPERRDPDAGITAEGAPGGEGPHLGHPRPTGTGQGRGLLPRPLQSGPVEQRVHPGRRLHRRQRQAPGPRTPHPGVVGRGSPVDLQPPSPRLGTPHPGCRALVPGGAHRRHHLPRRRPGAEGDPGTEHVGASLHPTQHRRHPRGHGHRKRAEHPLPRIDDADRLPTVGHLRRHPGQCEAVGSPADPAHLRQEAGHPLVLPVQRPGRGPVQGQRHGDPDHRRGARDQRRRSPVHLMGQHHPPVHPRVRDDHLSGQLGQRQR